MTGPAGPLVVLVTIIKRLVTCSRPGGHSIRVDERSFGSQGWLARPRQAPWGVSVLEAGFDGKHRA